MKSTGEVMCVDYQYSRALYKACIASGINVPHEGSILITVADMDKPEAAEITAGFADLGYEIMATGGTAEYLKEKGVKVTVATKVSEGSPNILDDIKKRRISMVINTTNHGRDAERDGFKIRRSTVEHAIACLTSMDTARELQHVMSRNAPPPCGQHRCIAGFSLGGIMPVPKTITNATVIGQRVLNATTKLIEVYAPEIAKTAVPDSS